MVHLKSLAPSLRFRQILRLMTPPATVLFDVQVQKDCSVKSVRMSPLTARVMPP